MFESLVTILTFFEELIWVYLGAPIILLLGAFLTARSGFIQIRGFPEVLRIFFSYFKKSDTEVAGVHPIKAFFASVGGCIGIANIVAVCTAVQIGGPGALFWIWVAALFGMILKYAEVYLGLKYRVEEKGQFLGGPMYFLSRAFSGMWAPVLFCLLFGLYGVEFYQFSVVIHSFQHNFHFEPTYMIVALMAAVFFAGAGGVKRVGAIASKIIPLFLLFYVSMAFYVIGANFLLIPSLLFDVFLSAFTGSAALGGFVGSTLMMALSHGIRRGCYSGDIGIGYAAVIYSESGSKACEKQASLIFFDIFLDTFVVCTLSILLILITGVWHQGVDASIMVQMALSDYFPYMEYFMPLFILLLGYSTINAYFVVGLRCASFLFPKAGAPFYYGYAFLAFWIFSFIDSSIAQTFMTVVGGLLLILNCSAIYKLRDEVKYLKLSKS